MLSNSFSNVYLQKLSDPLTPGTWHRHSGTKSLENMEASGSVGAVAICCQSKEKHLEQVPIPKSNISSKCFSEKKLKEHVELF